MRIQLNHILCTTDLSEASDRAIAYGIALAREFQAHLLICHCIDLPAPSIYGEAYLAPEEQLNRNIDYAGRWIAERMENCGVAWEPLLVVGHAADEINRAAREHSADITLTATRGRRGLKRLLLGSVTERLMRTLPCPLLVIPALQEQSDVAPKDALRFKKIMVGCDFSPDADLAFRNALHMAQEFQAELHLVHIIETPLYTETLKPVFAHRPTSSIVIQDFLQSKLDGLVPEDARHWCHPVTALEEGQPHARLLGYAETQAIDLIVLGVRGHSLMGTLFVGSTTDRIIRQAPCPVLSVCPNARNA